MKFKLPCETLTKQGKRPCRAPGIVMKNGRTLGRSCFNEGSCALELSRVHVRIEVEAWVGCSRLLLGRTACGVPRKPPRRANCGPFSRLVVRRASTRVSRHPAIPSYQAILTVAATSPRHPPARARAAARAAPKRARPRRQGRTPAS